MTTTHLHVLCSPRSTWGAEHSENMSLWFWISLWTSFSAVFWNVAAQSPSYTLRHSQVTFDQAVAACSPGHLTTVLDQHELAKILDLVPKAEPPLVQDSFTAWVGLRKAKYECMVSALPLKGFKWTADGSEETQVGRWAAEPELTCSAVQCAALKAQVSSLNVTEWGLSPDRCETKHRFICKHNDSQTPQPPKPTSPNPVPTSAGLEPRRSTRTPDTQTSGREAGSTHGPDSPYGSEDGGSDSCRRPNLSTARSLILDPKDRSRIQVECWTAGMQVEVRCSGQPALWRLLDGSVANFTSICVPCDDGFRKNSSGKCEDVDECREKSAPCRNTCQNTPGSYRCVCTGDTGEVVGEDSLMCNDTAGTADKRLGSGLLIPVLVAVAGLVVLVVLLAVTVKCCLMRRSKRRAEKKAEKMSMNSKDEKKPAI